MLDYLNKINHKLVYIVREFIDKECFLRSEMQECVTGSSEWCMKEMHRIMLVKECKDKLLCYEMKQSLYHCKYCIKVLLEINSEGRMVCPKCGIVADNLLYMENVTFHESSFYNKNNRHHYCHKEHFAQSLVDLANIGNRNVPNYIIELCENELGKGEDVSSMKVFDCLKKYKLRAYYQYKYEIANRLRGTREIHFSSVEILKMRDEFNRLYNDFFYFQDSKGLTKLGFNGKRRIYWPMRFILAEICKLINRHDVTQYIRPIASKKRYKEYKDNWDDFLCYVDTRYPRNRKQTIPTTFFKLKKTTNF